MLEGEDRIDDMLLALQSRRQNFDAVEDVALLHHFRILLVQDLVTNCKVVEGTPFALWTSRLKNASGSVTASTSPAAGDNFAQIWDVAGGKLIAKTPWHEDIVRSVTFSFDGRRIVTGSLDKTACVSDAKTGKEILVLRGHESWVAWAACNRDDTRIVTGSDDNTARIWDAATGMQLVVLRGKSRVTFAAFSPDGTQVITNDGGAIWDVHFATMSTKDLITEVCTRRLRGLTKLTRDEMRLAGYPDATPEIDVCAGIE